MTSDPERPSVTIQDVDRESERDDPSWAAQEKQLLIPASNLDLIPGMRSTGTSMDIFVRGVGVGLTHTENLIIKKLRVARETGDLEAETGEEPKKPDIGRVATYIPWSSWFCSSSDHVRSISCAVRFSLSLSSLEAAISFLLGLNQFFCTNMAHAYLACDRTSASSSLILCPFYTSLCFLCCDIRPEWTKCNLCSLCF